MNVRYPPPDQAKRYQSARIKLFFVGLGLSIGYLLIFQLSGFSAVIAAHVSGIFKSRGLIIAGYLFIFGGIYYAVTLPLAIYEEFILEKRYNLSRQSFAGWLKDNLKSLAISSVILLAFVELFYFLLIKSGLWWLWLAFIWFLFSICFTRVFPTLIIPLFYKYTPIENLALKQAIIDLAKKSGVKILDVFQIDFSKKTTKANAALVGLGRSKRIVLADNLLSNFTDSEVEVVVAHELGHHKYMHIWRIMIFGGVTNLAGFYFISLLAGGIVRFLNISHLYDIEAFPAISLVLTLLGFISTMVYNNYSRSLERDADAFALTATKNKEAFISCMKKLGMQNLADLSPNKAIEFLLYDHPSISKRIDFAEKTYR